MIANVSSGGIFGAVRAVPSKSYAHRILICAALSDRATTVRGITDAQDVCATLSCLEALSIGVERKAGECTITPVKPTKTAVLDCGESGSTLRFMLAVCAALGGNYTFSGHGRLGERPNDALLSALECGGVKVRGEGLPLQIEGKLTAKEYAIDGSVSSQYLTGLLLAAPLIGGDVKIKLLSTLKSRDYINITLDVMRRFGVFVEVTPDGFLVRGGQQYISPTQIDVEGDWSNSAFMLSAGLLCGEVKVSGLNAESVQGDRNFLSAVQALGGSINFEKDAFIAQKSQLFGAEICVEDIIDLAPVLAVLCAHAKGQSVLSGVSRLRAKESDRLEAIINLVSAFGGSATVQGDAVVITPGRAGQPDTVDGVNDHRVVMSAVVGGLKSSVSVTDAGAVKKSYPGFFSDIIQLGGKVDVSE